MQAPSLSRLPPLRGLSLVCVEFTSNQPGQFVSYHTVRNGMFFPVIQVQVQTSVPPQFNLPEILTFPTHKLEKTITRTLASLCKQSVRSCLSCRNGWSLQYKGKLETANHRTGHPIQLLLHLQNTCTLIPGTQRSSDSSGDNDTLLTHGDPWGAPKHPPRVSPFIPLSSHKPSITRTALFEISRVI